MKRAEKRVLTAAYMWMLEIEQHWCDLATENEVELLRAVRNWKQERKAEKKRKRNKK